jgi:hypothetical protein
MKIRIELIEVGEEAAALDRQQLAAAELAMAHAEEGGLATAVLMMVPGSDEFTARLFVPAGIVTGEILSMAKSKLPMLAPLLMMGGVDLAFFVRHLADDTLQPMTLH